MFKQTFQLPGWFRTISKFLSVFLVLLVAISLNACGGGNSTSENTLTQTPVPTITTAPITTTPTKTPATTSTPRSTPSTTPKEISAMDNTALWTEAHTALARFIGDGLTIFNDVDSGAATQSELDQLSRWLQDFDTATQAIANVEPPPEQQIMHQALLPVYWDMYGPMADIKDALASADPDKAELAWNRLALLLDQSGQVESLLMPDVTTTPAPTPTIVPTATPDTAVPTAIPASSPAITVSPSSSAPGSAVTVSGQGFSPNSSVYIRYRGSLMATAACNLAGNFTAVLMVPFAATSSSINVITVTDILDPSITATAIHFCQ